jgi:hypothetical protein
MSALGRGREDPSPWPSPHFVGRGDLELLTRDVRGEGTWSLLTRDASCDGLGVGQLTTNLTTLALVFLVPSPRSAGRGLGRGAEKPSSG